MVLHIIEYILIFESKHKNLSSQTNYFFEILRKKLLLLLQYPLVSVVSIESNSFLFRKKVDLYHYELNSLLDRNIKDVNRMANERPQLKPRILVVNVSPDISSQYVPMMNTILAAQKLVIHIPIISIRSGRSTIPFK